jgi:CO/xanthine dehydrogenase Mo-binding subunit
MATAGYPVAFFMRTQRVRAHLYADGTAVLQTASQEFGTGTATVMTQVAADGLGLDLTSVRFEFGDATDACTQMAELCALMEQLYGPSDDDTRP